MEECDIMRRQGGQMGRFFNKKKNKELSFVNDERREAARILGEFFLAWQDKWKDMKDIFHIQDSEEVRYFENDQREAVLRCLALLLCDFEYDDGEKFARDLSKLAVELRPEILPLKMEFMNMTGRMLEKKIGELVALNTKMLRFEEPSLSFPVAMKILREEVGIADFEFFTFDEENAVGREGEVSGYYDGNSRREEVEFSERLMI